LAGGLEESPLTLRFFLSKVSKLQKIHDFLQQCHPRLAELKLAESRMLSLFRRLMKCAEGATAIEYTLIASLIAVAAIASMRTVGGKVNNVLTNVSAAMT
jgi:pilus assembly protein Flp/PilA